MKKRPQREKATKKIIEITCKIQNIEVVEDFDKYAYSQSHLFLPSFERVTILMLYVKGSSENTVS